MTETALLLCGCAPLDADSAHGAAVVDELCRRPAAAAAALREAGAERVVLGLCGRRPGSELAAALRRAGAEPFGIEAVDLAGRGPAEAARLLAAARARLDALPAGERGRPSLNGGAISRRSLFSLGGAVTHAPVAALDETACPGTALCGLCVALCPVDAIAATQPVPGVDPGACTACGRCVPACPVGALRLTGSSPAQLEAQLAELVPGVEGVVLACASAAAEAPAAWALVELPTLALVTPGLLLGLRARGVAAGLAACDGACCAGAAAVEELAARLAVRPADGPLRLAEPAATLAALDPAVGGRAVESAASPLGLVSLDVRSCTLCGTCALACPVEALRLDGRSGETVLLLRPGACVACGRCAEACPERALEVRRGVDPGLLAGETVVLARAERELCAACGDELPPAPLRRRIAELLPGRPSAAEGLCARCASG